MTDKPDPQLLELFATWPGLPWYARWRVFLFVVGLAFKKRASVLWRTKP
jgi:hypothetical protein